MKGRLIIPVILSLGCTSLNAGSMGPVEPVYDFSGFYVGLGAGFTTLYSHDSFSTSRSDGVGGDLDTNHYTHTASLFTGQVGYGTMLQNRVYLGAKGSIYYTPLNNLNETGFSTSSGNLLISGDNAIRTQMRPIYNIDAVLGYEVAPQLLPFFEAGISFADIHQNYSIKRTRTNIATLANAKYETNISLDDYKTGFNVGLGMSYQLQQHWLFSTELVYNYLGKNSDSITTPIPNTSALETHSRTIQGSTVSMFGSVSYLFNT
ncbi:outer membrane beta-barrel protein [Legionella impletisoli]|uniref:Outer membrane protein beta-barrel domain-containing protein n=1 Tax=Legionella impletisoli TaxID=343510 RepID=A0A917NB94_9GAMM|nr:outer membrane beta-barrel protein [Legionella impletisoli]GGI85643.1 hypothetical protein GCM10007966_12770 [Legionella impletisoli]